MSLKNSMMTASKMSFLEWTYEKHDICECQDAKGPTVLGHSKFSISALIPAVRMGYATWQTCVTYCNFASNFSKASKV